MEKPDDLRRPTYIHAYKQGAARCAFEWVREGFKVGLLQPFPYNQESSRHRAQRPPCLQAPPRPGERLSDWKASPPRWRWRRAVTLNRAPSSAFRSPLKWGIRAKRGAPASRLRRAPVIATLPQPLLLHLPSFTTVTHHANTETQRGIATWEYMPR